MLGDQVDLEAWMYNVLDQHWYTPDVLYNLVPQNEAQPLPGAGQSFFVNVRARY